jgi:1,2-diacylglycerol 3-beta-glucosyltransferase
MFINTVLAILFIIPLVRIIFFYIGAIKERKKPIDEFANEEIPFVSVVIPARNEEENIRQCIISIAKSNYPKEKFEIIAVNDRSSDNTKAILEDLRKDIRNLEIVDIVNDSQKKNLRGKPGALQAGIDKSKGEIILMTDADCTVNSGWVSAMANSFKDPSVGLTAAYPAIRANTFFGMLQAVEWIYLHTLATAGIGLNIPLSCFGNNMAVRKKDFVEIGGYNGIKFSVTEDLALMHAIYKSGRKIRYLTSEKSTITTQACRTFKSYIKQKHRWVTGALDLGWIATLWVLTSTSLWAGIIMSLIWLEAWWLIAFLLMRFAGDSIITIPSAIILDKKKLIPWLVPAVIFFMFMELIAPFLLLKKDVRWKGQTF